MQAPSKVGKSWYPLLSLSAANSLLQHRLLIAHASHLRSRHVELKSFCGAFLSVFESCHLESRTSLVRNLLSINLGLCQVQEHTLQWTPPLHLRLLVSPPSSPPTIMDARLTFAICTGRASRTSCDATGTGCSCGTITISTGASSEHTVFGHRQPDLSMARLR